MSTQHTEAFETKPAAWHDTFIKFGDSVDIEKCLDCDCLSCSGQKFHCPYCTSSLVFNSHKDVVTHLDLLHWPSGVQFKDLLILSCNQICSETLVTSVHYHCPLCTTLVEGQSDFLTHLQQHLTEKNENVEFAYLPNTEHPASMVYQDDTIELCEDNCDIKDDFHNYCEETRKGHYHCPACKLGKTTKTTMISHLRQCTGSHVKIPSYKITASLPTGMRKLPRNPREIFPKWQKSIVRTLYDIPVRRCQQSRCCKKLFHCPLCVHVLGQPMVTAQIREHFKIHVNHAISYKGYIYLPCHLDCGDGSKTQPHYHCGYCGLIEKDQKHFHFHVKQCRRSSGSFPRTLSQSIKTINILSDQCEHIPKKKKKHSVSKIVSNSMENIDLDKPFEEPYWLEGNDDGSGETEMQAIELTAESNSDSSGFQMFDSVSATFSQAFIKAFDFSSKGAAEELLTKVAGASSVTFLSSPGIDPQNPVFSVQGSLKGILESEKVLYNELKDTNGSDVAKLSKPYLSDCKRFIKQRTVSTSIILPDTVSSVQQTSVILPDTVPSIKQTSGPTKKMPILCNLLNSNIQQSVENSHQVPGSEDSLSSLKYEVLNPNSTETTVCFEWNTETQSFSQATNTGNELPDIVANPTQSDSFPKSCPKAFPLQLDSVKHKGVFPTNPVSKTATYKILSSSSVSETAFSDVAENGACDVEMIELSDSGDDEKQLNISFVSNATNELQQSETESKVTGKVFLDSSSSHDETMQRSFLTNQTKLPLAKLKLPCTPTRHSKIIADNCKGVEAKLLKENAQYCPGVHIRGRKRFSDIQEKKSSCKKRGHPVESNEGEKSKLHPVPISGQQKTSNSTSTTIIHSYTPTVPTIPSQNETYTVQCQSTDKSVKPSLAGTLKPLTSSLSVPFNFPGQKVVIFTTPGKGATVFPLVPVLSTAPSSTKSSLNPSTTEMLSSVDNTHNNNVCFASVATPPPTISEFHTKLASVFQDKAAHVGSTVLPQSTDTSPAASLESHSSAHNGRSASKSTDITLRAPVTSTSSHPKTRAPSMKLLRAELFGEESSEAASSTTHSYLSQTTKNDMNLMNKSSNSRTIANSLPSLDTGQKASFRLSNHAPVKLIPPVPESSRATSLVTSLVKTPATKMLPSAETKMPPSADTSRKRKVYFLDKATSTPLFSESESETELDPVFSDKAAHSVISPALPQPTVSSSVANICSASQSTAADINMTQKIELDPNLCKFLKKRSLYVPNIEVNHSFVDMELIIDRDGNWERTLRNIGMFDDFAKSIQFHKYSDFLDYSDDSDTELTGTFKSELELLLEEKGQDFLSSFLIKNKKFSDSELTCQICSETCSLPGYLLAHMMTVHIKFKCPECPSLFTKRKLLAHHMKKCLKSSDEEPVEEKSKQMTELQCGECCEFFDTRKLIDDHQLTKHRYKPRCLICHPRKAFLNYRKLMDHVDSVHLSSQTGFPCDICGKFFSSQNLSRHRLRHTQKEFFQCPTCGKTLKDKATLKSHEEKHKPLEEQTFFYTCEYCGKRFRNKTAFKDHINAKHTGEKTYECKECGKRFTTLAVLSTHKFTKHTIRRFKCEICNRNFKFRKALRTHMVVHTQISKHVCPMCNRPFGQVGALKSHIVRCERNNGRGTWPTREYQKKAKPSTKEMLHSSSISGEKAAEFGLCKDTLEIDNFVDSVGNSHPQDYLYMCSSCNTPFPDISSAEIHIRHCF